MFIASETDAGLYLIESYDLLRNFLLICMICYANWNKSVLNIALNLFSARNIEILSGDNFSASASKLIFWSNF